MLGGMSCIRFPGRYNAVYDHEIFHEMMIKAVTTDSNLTSVVTAARESRMATSAQNPHMPTAEWFRQRTRNAEVDLMNGCIDTIISGQVASIKAAGRFPKRPVVAIDKHLIPRYDKNGRTSWCAASARAALTCLRRTSRPNASTPVRG